MLLVQLILYCLLFTLMVKLGVGGNALNGLYFYPKSYQEKVYELGLSDRETVKMKRIAFMLPFFAVMLIALLLIIGLWNGIRAFRPAYLQALLFLVVMNWFDGFMIDRLWVGHSSFWRGPGVNLPYVQSWAQIFKKRGILTLIWIAAGLATLIF